MASRVISRRILRPALDPFSSTCLSCRFTTFVASGHPRRFVSTAAPNPRKEPETITISRGKPSEDSIFEDEDYPAQQSEETGPDRSAVPEVDHDALMNTMDPNPTNRLKWERKKIIQQIRKRGQLTKEELLKRTEREKMVGSHAFKTSAKKLVMLARQIVGKPVDEAILQMAYSKKRVAQDVKKHLEYAKDMAIVERGMGLGKATETDGLPLEIQLKDGRRRRITDKSSIYVDQAWVNKGEYTHSPEYRGRGRVFMLTHRRARITVLLKEEKTRIRLAEERQQKINNRKLWQHLPDRPISLQRQYPLW